MVGYDFYEFLRDCTKVNAVRFNNRVPDYVRDGLINEIYIEAVKDEIPGCCPVIMRVRFHNRALNYLVGMKVTCRHTGEVFKYIPMVSLDFVKDVVVVDAEDDDQDQDLYDESLVETFAQLDCHQSKIVNRELDTLLRSDVPEDLKQRYEHIRDEVQRRKVEINREKTRERLRKKRQDVKKTEEC